MFENIKIRAIKQFQMVLLMNIFSYLIHSLVNRNNETYKYNSNEEKN